MLFFPVLNKSFVYFTFYKFQLTEPNIMLYNHVIVVNLLTVSLSKVPFAALLYFLKATLDGCSSSEG